MKRLLQSFALTLIVALAVVAQGAATAPAKGSASSTKKGSAAAADTKKGSATASDASVGVIDINTATAEELRQIPGIGDAYSAKIIANRPYRAKNELVDKKVLPAGVYAKVKDHLIAKGGGSTSAAASSGTGGAKTSSSKSGAKK